MSHPEFKDDDDIIKSLREKYTPEEIDAIIEVPQNSKVKYEFCTETQKIRVDRKKIACRAECLRLVQM
jgi:hypothetical protein